MLFNYQSVSQNVLYIIDDQQVFLFNWITTWRKVWDIQILGDFKDIFKSAPPPKKKNTKQKKTKQPWKKKMELEELGFLISNYTTKLW